MATPVDDLVARFLCRWVDAVRTRAGRVLAAVGIATLGLGGFAACHLGINSDGLSLIDPDLPFMRNQAEFSELYPVLDNALLVVVDAETPELAREATDALVERLSGFSEHFDDVYVPGGSRFFEEHGLLYRELEELEEFADAMARMQPVIAELERDASLVNLGRMVRLGLEVLHDEGGDEAAWSSILDRIGRATVTIYSEYPIAVSWEEMLLRGSAVEVSTRRVIVLHPLLDFGSLLAAGSSMRVIRDTAEGLGLVPERGVRVRITGNPALNYEEMLGLLWDIGVAGLFCFLLVAAVVYVALRSLRLVVAVVATLLVGLVWTAAFGAASVGDLNLASVSFAILFIGLGVDFGIHLGTRYVDLFAARRSHEVALREAVRGVGGSLVLCTVTTAIGFYVFVPTAFRGVSELGLISGTGMVVTLFLTLTFFPALLSSVLRLDPANPPRAGLRFRYHWWRGLARHPRAVRVAAVLVGLAGLAVVPHAYFEPNVVKMRDPTTESVQAFNDLLDGAGPLSPWFVNVVAPDLAAAERLAGRLDELEVVERTLTLADFVPQDQEEKVEILQDLALILDLPAGGPDGSGAPVSTEEQVLALELLYALLDSDRLVFPDGEIARSVLELRELLGRFLERVEQDGNAEQVVAELERVLLSSLPAQIARLRRAIETSGVEMEDLPTDLRRRMLAADGRARIQVFPSGDQQGPGSLEAFTDAVRDVAPQMVGVSSNLVELGRVTVSSFRQALISALVLVSGLLVLLWGRLSDAVLALCPLLLSALLTAASVVFLGIPFNFSNVVVIPLLLGIGVDSGIHLVHETRDPEQPGEDLLETTTARAVFYSALTTLTSFGSLAFSDHIGMRSLGILLSTGMVLTVVCNLVVLPALLDLRRSRAA